MYVLLHNPRCRRSREGKAALEEAGVVFEVREYLKEPLSLDELRILGKKLRLPPSGWLRFKEPEAKEAGIDKKSPPMEIYRAMAAAPRLMQRPILVGPEAAAVGRPDAAPLLRLVQGDEA